jgi:N-methylhydantoinase B
MRDAKEEQSRRWASLNAGYIPKDELQVDPSLKFHSEYDPDLDPITYEVLRSKFWNLNWDHQETIRRAAGSLVVVQGYDFNSCIQTELGEGVVFGPGNLFFAGCADVVVQWTLEHRSGSVGINDGDLFIQDDPWIGTNHAMDTAVYMPVFIDGRLFAWVYNVAHERELGGIEPGGFVQSAKDVYSESTFWPPVKLASGGVVREDLLDAWVRRSRIPGMMTIEVKAQIAGVNLARRRLLEMVQRYGAPVVKGAMQRMISDTAKAVGSRLAEIPDATWRDSRYVAGSHPDDRNLYKLCMTMTKTGDRLLISNEGTDAAAGSFNITAGTLRACMTSPLLLFLAWDQQLCGAGVLKQLDFAFAENAINSASHPAAVSTSLGLGMSLVQAQHLAAKMMSASRTARDHVFAASGLHTLLYNHMFGTDREGSPFANFPFDGTVGAIGAFAGRDGIHHGGGAFSMINPVGSVEAYEQEVPFLYLYRRELPASGGHGKYRGGATFVSAWTGHKSDEVYISSGGLFPSVTQGLGLLGGYPSSGGTMWHAERTAVLSALAAGTAPADPAQLRALAPDGSAPPPKKFDNRLSPGDLFEVMPQPGAGYGDPLDRDPGSVEADLRDGRLSAEDALGIYGAVAGDGREATVDREATAAERARRLTDRVSSARPPRKPLAVTVPTGGPRVLETVVLGTADGHDGPVMGCARCGQGLGAATEGYRPGCSELEIPLADFGPLFTDPKTETGVDLVFRRYLCPACGVALEGEICRKDDDPQWDVRTPASQREGLIA